MHRVGAGHGATGQPEISAELAGGARQQPGATDIGEKSDPDFRHADLGSLGDDAMAAMRRQTDAAAHHDAVHDGNVRFRKRRNARVHNVFFAPEDLAEIGSGARAFIEAADGTAAAPSALAGPPKKDK